MRSCFSSANILLPDFGRVDPRTWAVVACDQFTSEPDYWASAEALVGNAPSSLRLMLPEVYLADSAARIPHIQETMNDYLDTLLCAHPDSMILTERTQSDGTVRRGLVLAVDLDCYDYQKGATSLIRATEATVVERIPPRVAIRRGAALELPHVMLLIDDPAQTVLEPLAGAPDGAIAYDTELMLEGGHLTGRFLSPAEIDSVSRALTALASPDAMERRYGDAGLAPLLFAVGDGNHSLASAKAAYEEIKSKLGAEAAAAHPARYALVEVVNIHDPALQFEPIYRVLFGVDPTDVLRELERYLATLHGDAPTQTFDYLFGTVRGSMTVSTPVRQLTVGTLQDFIDGYLAAHPSAEVDYIHGEDSLEALSARDGAIGFLFSGMEKSQLFPTVMFDGALPRKTFSMGHARDKRYYMECRKITL